MRGSSLAFWINVFRLLRGVITACDRLVRDRDTEDRKAEPRKIDDSKS